VSAEVPTTLAVDARHASGRIHCCHSAETCLPYYAHLFAEFDPAHRVSAGEEIRKARAELDGRSEDAAPDQAEAA
jgi:hypothetical protein